MIRDLLPDELDSLCARIAAMDPWLRLGIQGEAMAANLRLDTERRVMVWSEHGLILGAVSYRASHFAQLVFNHGFGPQLAARAGLDWPCDWQAIPDGGYINALVVFPGGQGKGLGTALLAAAEQKARDAGMTRNYLMVSDTNKGAQRLYHRNGYEKIASVENCLKSGNTEWLAEKKLT